MSRSDLERLSKEELIELVLKLHRPERPRAPRPSRRPRAAGLGYEGGYDAVRRYAKTWKRQQASVTAPAFVPLAFALGEAVRRHDKLPPCRHEDLAPR